MFIELFVEQKPIIALFEGVLELDLLLHLRGRTQELLPIGPLKSLPPCSKYESVLTSGSEDSNFWKCRQEKKKNLKIQRSFSFSPTHYLQDDDFHLRNHEAQS